MGEAGARVRLDKWLWAARFFKTRQLAAEAVSGGKVHLNGERTKAGRELRVGARLTIHKGSLSWEVTVIALATRRGPAREAQQLYEEDEASRVRREQQVRQLREQAALAPAPERGRPTKRDRRLIHRFTGKES